MWKLISALESLFLHLTTAVKPQQINLLKTAENLQRRCVLHYGNHHAANWWRPFFRFQCWGGPEGKKLLPSTGVQDGRWGCEHKTTGRFHKPTEPATKTSNDDAGTNKGCTGWQLTSVMMFLNSCECVIRFVLVPASNSRVNVFGKLFSPRKTFF